MVSPSDFFTHILSHLALSKAQIMYRAGDRAIVSIFYSKVNISNQQFYEVYQRAEHK